MIIIRLSGGLGNQMFQYALGRALACASTNELVLDISSYDMQKPGEAQRAYTLERFRIEGRLATPADFAQIGIADPRDTSRMARLRRKISALRGALVTETTFAFMPNVAALTGDRYLIGVWQSEKYFADRAAEIRNDFTLKNPLSAPAAAMRAEIESSGAPDAVALHVRRGDQVSDPHLVKKHGLLTDDYYRAAISRLRSERGALRFFVFSDEPEWVRQNLDVGADATIVSGRSIPDYEELVLMSLCKHQIIAKSSFSWWGAWLNAYPNKIVIAPKQRFGSADRTDDKDLIPASWLQL